MNKKLLLAILVVCVVVLFVVFYNKPKKQEVEQYVDNAFGVTIPLGPDDYPGTTIVANNTKETLLLASFGTGTVRGAKIYDIKNNKEIASFCHLGDPVFWNDYVLYQDCTESKDFEIRAQTVENGQFKSVIYKLNPFAGEKEVLIASDNLHNYRLPNQSDLKDSDLKVTLKMTFVDKFDDWSDIHKWQEGEKTVKLK